MSDNKHSYFHVQLDANESYWLINYERKQEDLVFELEGLMEPVLTRMGAEAQTYIISNVKNKGSVWFLFKTTKMKRLALLNNLISKNVTLSNLQGKDFKTLKLKKNRPSLYFCECLTKKEFEKTLEEYKENKLYKIKGEESEYSGADIELLNDRNNWYEWQKELYKIIFKDHNTIRNAETREIIFIEDRHGNAGKSTFWKWLYVKHRKDIGILSEATSTQLKANVVNLGAKKLYIIDLPRTTSEIGTTPLINALEALKNGIVNTSMYGSTDVMIMDPPWIVLTGNNMPASSWTPDRWSVYSINNDKKKSWTDNSISRRKEAKKEIELEIEIQEIKSKVKKMRMEKTKETLKKFEGQLAT